MIRLLVALAATGCVDDHGPRLETVTPAAAGRGTQVRLTGSRLCGDEADCDAAGGEVQIGINPPVVLASVIDYADTFALIEVPTLAETGSTQIVVTVNDRASNALEFEVLP